MNIGFIGLGIMGEAMCANIIKKHDGKVFLYDLDCEKVEKIVSLGGFACNNSAELAEKSRPAAVSGTLGIYVGSDEETFEKIRPILAYMGSNIIRMGKNGMGLVMKICHNTLVAQIQNGVNETLALARLEGISVDDFALAISYGGGQNFYLDGQAQNIKNENWTTAFSLENMHKDLGICERLSEEAHFPMPGMENAKAVYDKGMAEGLGKEDFRATYKVVSGE